MRFSATQFLVILLCVTIIVVSLTLQGFHKVLTPTSEANGQGTMIASAALEKNVFQIDSTLPAPESLPLSIKGHIIGNDSETDNRQTSGQTNHSEETADNVTTDINDSPTEIPTPEPTATPAPPKLVNINTAGSLELQSLPGIGPVLAERIKKYRAEKGHFLQKEDITKVKGIGPHAYKQMKDFITVGE